MPINSWDYQATLEAQHGTQMPIEEENVPPTNFQRLDSGVRIRGSEIKARGTETAKKAEKGKNTESNWNKFAAIA